MTSSKESVKQYTTVYGGSIRTTLAVTVTCSWRSRYQDRTQMLTTQEIGSSNSLSTSPSHVASFWMQNFPTSTFQRALGQIWEHSVQECVTTTRSSLGQTQSSRRGIDRSSETSTQGAAATSLPEKVPQLRNMLHRSLCWPVKTLLVDETQSEPSPLGLH
jgi:hypothetical protein